MHDKNLIPVEKGGVYLFSAPAKISAQIDRDLLVMFTVPSRKISGAIVFDIQSPIKELIGLLQTLYNKFTDDFKTKSSEIKIKIFGLSVSQKSILATAKKWIDLNDLNLIAEDTGRGVSRELVIDCETGLVGVSYAEGFDRRQGLLALGTAAGRNSGEAVQLEVLVLTLNRVHRQLCQQAIEETPQFKATSPASPFDVVMRFDAKNFPWSAVLIFDDIGRGKPVEKWIGEVSQTLPHVKVCWVGKTRPAFGKKLPLLQPLTPETMKKFKRELGKELAVPTVLAGQTSDVIAFPAKSTKRKTKRRKRKAS